MFKKQIAMAAVAFSVATLPAARVAADAGDVAAGVLLGVIGTTAVQNANKNKKKTYTVNTAQRAQTREVQTSLNYFGFPAGTPDGVAGSRTRSAVSQYQIFMGYPATGYLTEYERQFLVSSYHRAVAGGGASVQMAAASPMGTKVLLKNYQQEAAGFVNQQPQAVPGAGNTVVVVAPQTGTAPQVPATTEVATTVAPAPQAQPQTAALPSFGTALPSFGQGQSASLASHCNKVSLMTSSNGGFVTEASMQDGNSALNEQFCLARTYAIAQGEEMASQIQGFTPAQIVEQCKSFGPAMKEQINAVSLQPQQAVLQQVGAFVQSSGMSPAQLAGTAKICLSSGYRTDDMDVAIASALMLVALGEPVYSELLGHHLSQGFGAAKRSDLALVWYQTGIDAINSGAQPVFAPGQPERTALIQKAAYQVGGANGASNTQGAVVVPQPAALPTFTAPANN